MKHLITKIGACFMLLVLALSVFLVGCDEVQEAVKAQDEKLASISEECKALGDKLNSLAELSATKEALADALKKLEENAASDQKTAATLETTRTDLAAALKKLDENAASIQKTAEMLEAAKANLAALAARVETTESASAVSKTAIEALKATIGEIEGGKNISSLIESLRDRIATLEAFKTELGDIRAEVTSLLSQVAAMEESSASKTDVAGLRNDLTALQSKVLRLFDEDGKTFAELYNEATAALYAGEYSRDAFDAIVNNVATSAYADDDINKFREEADRLKFFLNRAVSLKEIKDIFAQLHEKIEAMPTLAESFERELDAITIITVDTDLAKANNIYNKIVENGIELDETLASRYSNMVGAKNNLLSARVAADALTEEIRAIVLPLVYIDSESAVASLESGLSAIRTNYFSNTAYNALYGELTAETFVTDAAKIAQYRERMTTLTAAAVSKPAFIALVTNFDTSRPLWSDLAAINENRGVVDAWIAQYQLESQNVEKMYGAETYALLDRAKAYAGAMNDLYENKEIATLKANLTALVDKTPVLFHDAEYAAQLRNAITGLSTAIEGVTDYNAELDRNFAEMLGDLSDFELLEVRMAELAEAKGKVEDALEAVADITEVTRYDQWTPIKTLKETLDGICEDYGIPTADDPALENDNYETVVGAAYARYDALIQGYDMLTEQVRNIYITVTEALAIINAGEKIDLAQGKEIYRIAKEEIGSLAEDLGVTDTGTILTIRVEGIDTQVTLDNLFAQFATVRAKYHTQATAAQTDAAEVHNAIAALGNAADLKQRQAITEAFEALEAWAATHLVGMDEIDLTKPEDRAALRAKLEEIADISIFAASGGTYEFLAVADYDSLIGKYDTVEAQYAAAEQEANALKDRMNALIAHWDVHSDFAGVCTDYEAYVDTYYAGSVTETGYFGENTLYQEFVALKEGAYQTACDGQDGAAEAINNAIDALEQPAGITMANAATVLSQTTAIKGQLADFKSTYCDGTCGIFGDREFTLDKADKMADIANKYAIAYAAANEETQQTLANALNDFLAWMTGADNSQTLDTYYQLATTRLNKILTDSAVA